MARDHEIQIRAGGNADDCTVDRGDRVTWINDTDDDYTASFDHDTPFEKHHYNAPKGGKSEVATATGKSGRYDYTLPKTKAMDQPAADPGIIIR